MKVTINKQQFDLEQVVSQAVESASDGYVCPPDQRMAAGSSNPKAAYLMTIARYIGKATGWTPRWDKLNADDLLSSVAVLNQSRGKRAGVRALESKYGHDSAERIVSKYVGKKVNLR